MESKILLNPDEIIEIDYSKPLDQDSTKTMIEKVVGLMARMRNAKKPVLLLIDLSNLAYSDDEVEALNGLAMQQLDYDKIAGFGASEETTDRVNKLIVQTGQQHRNQIFSTREEATEWLKQGLS